MRETVPLKKNQTDSSIHKRQQPKRLKELSVNHKPCDIGGCVGQNRIGDIHRSRASLRRCFSKNQDIDDGFGPLSAYATDIAIHKKTSAHHTRYLLFISAPVSFSSLIPRIRKRLCLLWKRQSAVLSGICPIRGRSPFRRRQTRQTKQYPAPQWSRLRASP